jgi:hypothetical protein
LDKYKLFNMHHSMHWTAFLTAVLSVLTVLHRAEGSHLMTPIQAWFLEACTPEMLKVRWGIPFV